MSTELNGNIRIISIEGNIGSGKTTLLKKLKEKYVNNPNIIFLKEPVDEWEQIKDKDGQTMLQKFYADQQKYSFAFQMMAYISRLKILRDTVRNINLKIQESLSRSSDYESYGNTNNNYVIITERSLYTDKYVFAKMLYDQGKIEDVCYKIYLNWFEEFAKSYPVINLVYVNTDPVTCYDRIHLRARQGEEVIPLNYLKECHQYHIDFIENTPETTHQMVLKLDGNKNIYDNPSILDQWLQEIGQYVIKLY